MNFLHRWYFLLKNDRKKYFKTLSAAVVTGASGVKQGFPSGFENESQGLPQYAELRSLLIRFRGLLF